MPKAQKEDFLRRADMQVWARFLNSDEGRRGISYLRLACPKKEVKQETDYLHNAIGFDFWQECINEVNRLADVPERPEKIEDDRLEQ